ncbi:MAG: hypothetical protein KDC00_09245 [Flavobacteriales bacterium]|nr:hypothetical protein [Flavobacteriales bacterium]
MSTAKTKRPELVYAALLSEDHEAVLTALDRIEVDGDARAIRPLLTTLVGTKNTEVRKRITGLLNTLKATNAVGELLLALDEPKFKTERSTVVSAFWNAGLDVREHLDVFVGIALEGSAEECFECLTVIENQEIWPEKAVRRSTGLLKKAVPLETDSYKAAMLKDLLKVLEFRLGPEGA